MALHENVLRIPVGGPQAMAAQLEHIARLMRERTAVVTVLAYEAGAHAAMGGMLQLMEFDDAPPVAYTETSFSGTLVDVPAVVKRAQRAYDLLRVAALSPEASLALVESAAEDFQTMREYDLSNARWTKSSYSNGEGGSCVEVADGVPRCCTRPGQQGGRWAGGRRGGGGLDGVRTYRGGRPLPCQCRPSATRVKGALRVAFGDRPAADP